MPVFAKYIFHRLDSSLKDFVELNTELITRWDLSLTISCNFLSQTFESRTVGKYPFLGCCKTLLKPKTLGMQLAQIVKEFLKKCLFLAMCLVPFIPSIQRATFPKINLEILVSLLDVFSTLTSPDHFWHPEKKIA